MHFTVGNFGCITFAFILQKIRKHTVIFDETTGGKKPNETVSFLDHYIENILDKGVKQLILFSDNCCAQNKNYTLVQ